jgi:hypothetical protein
MFPPSKVRETLVVVAAGALAGNAGKKEKTRAVSVRSRTAEEPSRDTICRNPKYFALLNTETTVLMRN